jgi:hypothetical protein
MTIRELFLAWAIFALVYVIILAGIEFYKDFIK